MRDYSRNALPVGLVCALCVTCDRSWFWVDRGWVQYATPKDNRIGDARHSVQGL
jgi:hypothetical protein